MKDYSMNLTPSETRKFYKLWDENDRDGLFYLCNDIRTRWGVPEYDSKKWNEGWSYRMVLHEDREIAWYEFFNLCFGWW